MVLQAFTFEKGGATQANIKQICSLNNRRVGKYEVGTKKFPSCLHLALEFSNHCSRKTRMLDKVGDRKIQPSEEVIVISG